MNTESRITLLYITKNGRELCEKLKNLFPEAKIELFSKDRLTEQWKNSDCLIFIMATGIVVRAISPYLKDKRHDPCVLVLDEMGKFVIPLIGGHLRGANALAKRIASYMKAEAVITTSSDLNQRTAIDLWIEENQLVVENPKLLPKISKKLIEDGKISIYFDKNLELPIPEDFQVVEDERIADMVVTNRQRVSQDKLYLRKKNLILGIGINSDTGASEIKDIVEKTLKEYDISLKAIKAVATIDRKLNEKGLRKFSEDLGIPLLGYKKEELERTIEKNPSITHSEIVRKTVGVSSVAEASALAASEGGELIVKKIKSSNVTIAIAEMKKKTKKGHLYIIGIGPGNTMHLTFSAREALEKVDTVVGYHTYINLIQPLINHKDIITTGMTKEIERCKKAIDLAISGKKVALVSGGDPGIYGMAGLVFEILKEKNIQNFDVSVIPGISALNACGALLGAPLMHDFAVISLSDRLTPWETIEKRLHLAAEGDFVIVLFNPKSMGRKEQVERAQRIILHYRPSDTPVGIVRSAMREDENYFITNLGQMLEHQIDMQTTVFIGNSRSFVWNNYLITPRGYRVGRTLDE